MDTVPLEDVARFESELHDFFHTRHGDALETIRATGKLPEGDVMANAAAEFAESFIATVAADA